MDNPYKMSHAEICARRDREWPKGHGPWFTAMRQMEPEEYRTYLINRMRRSWWKKLIRRV